jgi:hypothetical protein
MGYRTRIIAINTMPMMCSTNATIIIGTPIMAPIIVSVSSHPMTPKTQARIMHHKAAFLNSKGGCAIGCGYCGIFCIPFPPFLNSPLMGYLPMSK